MKNWLTRISMPVTVAAAAAFAFAGVAGPAAAAPTPNKPGPPVPSSLEWPCPGFNVTLTLTGRVKTIDLPGERQVLASPNLRVTATANGKTVSYLITGATHVTYLPNATKPEVLEITSTGLNLLLIPETSTHPSGLVLTTGNVNYAITPTGDELRPFSGSGRTVDVCQVLA